MLLSVISYEKPRCVAIHFSEVRQPTFVPQIYRVAEAAALHHGQASLYDVLDRMIHELRLDSITSAPAYMAFNFTMAMFPTIIFLFTLIPYIPVPNLNMDILQFLSDIMPREMYVATASTIEDIVNIPHGGLLSFGFLTALVLTSNGIMALLDAFEKKYPSFKRRTYVRKRVIATAAHRGALVGAAVCHCGHFLRHLHHRHAGFLRNRA